MNERIERPVARTTGLLYLAVAAARTTGLLYLAVAAAGMLGFLLVRPMVFDPADPGATAARVLEHEGLARVGIALELGLVIVQSLAALWFFRLFRAVDSFAAAGVAVFGTMNAVAVMGSAASLGTALDGALAGDGVGPSMAYLLSENLWAVGNVFFGLWLVPMGLLVLRAGMPRVLGWLLVAGGVGYVASAMLGYLAPSASVVTDLLVIPATVGELWMIALLLWVGFRRPRASLAAGASRDATSPAAV